MPENQISNKIKSLIIKSGVKKAAICKVINMTSVGFDKMLKTNSYKVDTLQKIADFFEINIVDFFDDIRTANAKELWEENRKLELDIKALEEIKKNLTSNIHWLINFILANTFYKEIINSYVLPTDYMSIVHDIEFSLEQSNSEGKDFSIRSSNPIFFINTILFQQTQIAEAFQNGKVKHPELLKQFNEWKKDIKGFSAEI